ncbi:MAG: hypothetical protein QXP53_01530 [Candidatus Pacearchaeota archaeon]
MINGKKALSFGIMLFLMTIIIIGVSMYFFVVNQKKLLKNTISAQEILDFEQESLRIEIYAKESANLAASQALYKMAEKSFIQSDAGCLVYKDKLIWQENCKPENLKSWFSEQFKTIFSDIIKKYPENLNFSVALNNESVIEIKINKKINDSISFNFSKDLKINLNFTEYEISLEEISKLYEKVKELKERCENAECIENNLLLKNWDVHVSKEASYFLIDAETKNNHFIKKGGVLSFEKIKTELVF